MLIASEPDLEVCGEAESGPEAVAKVEKTCPDLAVVDLSLKDSSGLELIKDLRSLRPDLPVLALSMHDESVYAERVLRAGGRGYIMKQEGGQRVMTAIRQVLSGKVYVSEKMAARILELFSGTRSEAAVSPVERLSDREFEIFELIGQGKGTREIAGLLRLSVKTVEVHRGHIKDKLGLKDGTALVHHAVRWVESQQSGRL